MEESKDEPWLSTFARSAERTSRATPGVRWNSGAMRIARSLDTIIVAPDRSSS